MKPTKTFKLKKQYKRILATIANATTRAGAKAAYIQAQLASEQQPSKDKS